MPRTIRFHLDENCPRALAVSLRRRGIDVTSTSEPGLLEATDEVQTAHALSEGRVIFTQDEESKRIEGRGDPDGPHERRSPQPQLESNQEDREGE